MNDKIKIYSDKQYLNGYIQHEFLTSDGDADIYLKLNQKDELFDNRTVLHQIDLSHEIYDFIEEKVSMLNSDIAIRLHILGLDLDSKEQGLVKHLIKEHYAIELYKAQRDYIQCKNKILYLVLLGLFTFLTYTFLFFYSNFEFFLEVFGFLFSFSLWVAGESYIYDFSDIKNERKAISQYLLINVVFEKKENL